MMFPRELRLSTGNKFAAIALGTMLLLVVGVFLAFGFLLIVGLTVAGLVLGAGAALYRRLSGQARAQRNQMHSHAGLDPSLEIEAPPAPRGRREQIGGGETPQ